MVGLFVMNLTALFIFTIAGENMKIKMLVCNIKPFGKINFPDEHGFRIKVCSENTWKQTVLVDFRTIINKSFYIHKRMVKYEN